MSITTISEINNASFFNDIEQGAGFCLASMTSADLDCIRKLVTEQYLHVLQVACPEHVGLYHGQCMSHYHKIYKNSHFEHGNIWRKQARVLGPNSVNTIQSLAFFKNLKSILGEFSIADEEHFGWPGIYWRLVRPGGSDIGPIHADKWFWDLGHGDMPEGFYRLKIWIALYAEPEKSGLRVVPESQLKDDWNYHGEKRGDIIKPVLDEKLDSLNLYSLPLSPGEFVVFHDKLLHGGMPNNSDTSRVSIEFTMLVPENNSDTTR